MSTAIAARVEELIATNMIMVFSKTYCGYCAKSKQLLEQNNKTYTSVELDIEPQGQDMMDYLKKKTGQRTVPNIFIKQQHIGGCDDLFALHKKGKL